MIGNADKETKGQLSENHAYLVIVKNKVNGKNSFLDNDHPF